MEALANHRSSVLGAIPGLPQPSQKRFDTLVWDALRRFDPLRPVYVESESKKVGNVSIASPLVERMRTSACLNLTLPHAQRVALLMEDYDFFVKDTTHFCERLDVLAQFRGKAVVDAWKQQVLSGNVEKVVSDLLTEHYDPVYLQSIARNFVQYSLAQAVTAEDRDAESMQQLATSLLAGGSR